MSSNQVEVMPPNTDSFGVDLLSHGLRMMESIWLADGGACAVCRYRTNRPIG